MVYSLLNVTSEKDGLVSGNWIQDHHGTLESARKLADETEAVNSHGIDVAVVPQLASTQPILCYWQGIQRLA